VGAALLVSSIRRSADDAPVAAAAPVTPATQAGPVATAQPWDATDTQSVEPVVYGPTPGSAIDPSDGGGYPA
jgi:hypothetical protein